MFCHYCGKEIKDNASFCPYCGKGIAVATVRNAASEETSLQKNRKQKKLPWIVLIVIAVVLAAAALGNAIIFTWFSREDPTEETFEAYYQEFTDDDVLYENGALFVDSQLLLTAKEGTPKEKVQELVEEQDGEIVGYISISDDYQIEFPKGKTYDNLNDIITQWSEEDCTENVALHSVFKFDTDSVDYKSDPWLKTGSDDKSGLEWSEAKPNGYNWWAEAIMMPTVWNLDIDYQTVKVGVIDSMFDTEHADLKSRFVKTWQNPDNVSALYADAVQREKAGEKILPSNYAHGTHVAGLIAAEAENGIGIAGVSQNAELYGFAVFGESAQTYVSNMALEYAIAELLGEGVKVINISMGNSELSVSACLDALSGQTSETSVALKSLTDSNAVLESFLAKCLKQYDFLIVKSAGNDCNDKWSKNLTPDEDHPYSYYLDDDNGAIYSNLSAQYQPFAGVENVEVRNRILIVGSVDMKCPVTNNPYFELSDFTEREADLYAPGGTLTYWNLTFLDVLSDLMPEKVEYTILSDIPGYNSTDSWTGTSMSTPIVSGIAALVWGINPNLTAVEVGDIILNSSTYNDLDINVVNAATAVTLALESREDTAESEQALAASGFVMGYPYVPGEKEDEVVVVTDAQIMIYDADDISTAYEVEIAADGTFCEILQPGKYGIKVESDNYGSYMTNFYITEHQVTYLAMEMERLELSNVYLEFLTKQGYQSYISDWIYGEPSEYAILDINSDGCEELIITGGDGLGFYNFSVFGYDQTSGEIYAFSMSGSAMFGEEYMGAVAQYYGSLQYSPQYHALVFTELNNGSYYDSYGYWVIEDKKLDVDFSLWFESAYNTQQTMYGITDSGSRKTISEHEYDSYVSESIVIVFQPISSIESDVDLKDILFNQVGNVSIVDFCESDYDFDGKTEAFAIVGDVDEFGSCFGDLYFITENGVETVLHNEGFWIYDEVHHLLDFSDARFYVTGRYYTTGDAAYVFGVADGKWYQDALSLRGMSLTQIAGTNELTITQSAYDYSSGGTGHTWKPYYLYWDNGFHEYGGITISTDDFLLCHGADQIYNQIINEGFTVTNIIYRANGIIHINYTDGDSNHNVTLLLEGSSVTVQLNSDDGTDPLTQSDNGGIYAEAFLPDIAVYPSAFPLTR